MLQVWQDYVHRFRFCCSQLHVLMRCVQLQTASACDYMRLPPFRMCSKGPLSVEAHSGQADPSLTACYACGVYDPEPILRPIT